MKHPFGIRLAVKLCGLLLLGHAATASAVMNTPASWSVSPSGAYTYEMPFRLPPGIAGVQPKVSLEYSSQSGNGIAGMGWSLGGLSAIARCPATMTIDGVRGGVNMDANDRLCMDGQRLMLQTGTYGAEGATYSTQLYNGARIVGAALTGTDHSRTFKVYTKAGELMEYTPFNTPANNAALQFVLSRVTDAKGNYWQVHYQADIAQGEIYPKAICYTGNSRLNQAPKNCIEFGYGSETSRFGTPVQRADKSLAYVAGFALRNNQRLSGVRTLINATATASGNTWTLSGTQVTEYKLGYDSAYRANNKTLLKTVQECTTATVCLPVQQMAYNEHAASPAMEVKPRFYTGGHATYYTSMASQADFNGDARTDLLMGENAVYRSKGDGTFDGSYLIGIQPPGDGSPPVQETGNISFVSGDFNGDGKAELLRFSWSSDCYDGSIPFNYQVWKPRDDGQFDVLPGPALYGGSCVLRPASGPLVKDFNGDGREELLLGGMISFSEDLQTATAGSLGGRIQSPMYGFRTTLTLLAMANRTCSEFTVLARRWCLPTMTVSIFLHVLPFISTARA